MLADLTLDFFHEFKNQTIPLTHAEGEMMLTLTEVCATGSEPSPVSKRQPFSLIFKATADGTLPQGIYPLNFGNDTVLDIFIVPLKPNDSHSIYQAIFS